MTDCEHKWIYSPMIPLSEEGPMKQQRVCEKCGKNELYEYPHGVMEYWKVVANARKN